MSQNKSFLFLGCFVRYLVTAMRKVANISVIRANFFFFFLVGWQDGGEGGGEGRRRLKMALVCNPN
jgi:hypothetical protein